MRSDGCDQSTGPLPPTTTTWGPGGTINHSSYLGLGKNVCLYITTIGDHTQAHTQAHTQVAGIQAK